VVVRWAGLSRHRSALFLGLVFANVLQPGHGLTVELPTNAESLGLKTGALNFKDFITHVFPKNIFEAMATNEVLQILVFSRCSSVSLWAT
jgi:Na+/H+-dicarboxylate symporter